MAKKNPYSQYLEVTYHKGHRLPWQIDLFHAHSGKRAFDRRMRGDFPGGLPVLLNWLTAHEPQAEIRLASTLPGMRTLVSRKVA